MKPIFKVSEDCYCLFETYIQHLAPTATLVSRISIYKRNVKSITFTFICTSKVVYFTEATCSLYGRKFTIQQKVPAILSVQLT